MGSTCRLSFVDCFCRDVVVVSVDGFTMKDATAGKKKSNMRIGR